MSDILMRQNSISIILKLFIISQFQTKQLLIVQFQFANEWCLKKKRKGNFVEIKSTKKISYLF